MKLHKYVYYNMYVGLYSNSFKKGDTLSAKADFIQRFLLKNTHTH